jgi:hypothetical protein
VVVFGIIVKSCVGRVGRFLRLDYNTSNGFLFHLPVM